MFLSKVSRQMFFAAVLGLVCGNVVAAVVPGAVKAVVANAYTTGKKAGSKKVVRVEVTKNGFTKLAILKSLAALFGKLRVMRNQVVWFYDKNGKVVLKEKRKISADVKAQSIDALVAELQARLEVQ